MSDTSTTESVSTGEDLRILINLQTHWTCEILFHKARHKVCRNKQQKTQQQKQQQIKAVQFFSQSQRVKEDSGDV